jgi:hypothetical protein
MIGTYEGKQVLYDIDSQVVVEVIGSSAIIPKPGGDIALSSDGRFLVNGYSTQGSNYYVIIRRSDGAYVQTRGFDQHYWPGGDLRNDPAPCWNRDSTQILIPVIAGFPPQQTRQLFLLKLKGV